MQSGWTGTGALARMVLDVINLGSPSEQLLRSRESARLKLCENAS